MTQTHQSKTMRVNAFIALAGLASFVLFILVAANGSAVLGLTIFLGVLMLIAVVMARVEGQSFREDAHEAN